MAQVSRLVNLLHAGSDQPLLAEADMSFAADYEMVVQGDTQGGGRIAHLPRHLDIGTRGRRVAARMVMHHESVGRRSREGLVEFTSSATWHTLICRSSALFS